MAVTSWDWDNASESRINVRTEHAGLVVGLREYNGYDDSDFYAIVWDPSESAPFEVMYGTTRGYMMSGAEVDAPPEIMSAYKAYRDAQRAEYEASLAARDAAIPSVGKRVRVIRGRKVPAGTTGDVIWYGPDNYRRGASRVGIKDDAGNKHWTSASNVEVITD